MSNGERKMLLVVGTGRSGTCWVGDILTGHPEITGYVEPKPLFSWVTEAAVDAPQEPHLMPRIHQEYIRLWETAAPNHLADKCHPGIWIAETLAERFPNAYFIGVLRDVAPTVASMLRHQGVRRWCEQWDRYPVPNRFLGISDGNFAWYQGASIVERCTVRWLAHQRELHRLQRVLGRRFFLLNYQTLVTDPCGTLSRLQEFAGLTAAFADPSPRTSTLTNWQQQLTARDRELIQSALERHGASTASMPRT